MLTRHPFGVMAAAMLASIVALEALSLHTAAQLRDDMADLLRLRDATLQVRSVSATLLDVVTHQRGYLLTADAHYLDRYRQGLVRLDKHLDALSASTTTGSAESEAVRRLRSQTDIKREQLARSIRLADTAGFGAALTAMREERGVLPLDDILGTLQQVDGLFVATQAQRHATRAAGIQRQEQLELVLLVALTLMLAALYGLFRRHALLQSALLKAETSARESLAQRVSEGAAQLQATSGRLALSEDRLRGIFEAASDGIMTTDAGQIIIAANAASAQMFHCKVTDLIGTPLDRLIPARYRASHGRHMVEFAAGTARARRMGRSDAGRETVALRFDGEEFPIEASISHTEVSGERLYTVIHRDITERRRAEEALRRSEQLLAATFSASNVAMAQIDPATHRFMAVNNALCSLSGYTEAELLAMQPDDLNHPLFRVDKARLDALVRGTGGYHVQKCIVRKDGQSVWIDVSGSVVRDAEGRALRVVGLLQDISARRQAEETLRASEARLSFLVRLNDRLKELDDPQAIAYEASCLLGEFARVERVGYAEDSGDGETITVARNFTRDVPCIEGRYRYADYGADLLADLRRGCTVVRPDIAGDPSLSADVKAAHARLQLGATVNVPLRHDSQLDAVFFVHAAAARNWSGDEIRLFEDVALRIRADLARARAQAAVGAAKATLEAALGSMNDAVFISDTEGRFIDFNDAFVSFHRFRTRHECRRTLAEYQEILDVLMADGTAAPLEQWAVSRALRGEVGSGVEYRLRRKDTGESWVGSFSFAPVRAADGRIVGSVVAGRDVTLVKRTQEDLAASRVTLQHLVASLHRAQEDERKRIARELHDDLQQSLAAIRMDALAVGERLARKRSDVDPLLARIDKLSGAAIESTRRIVNDLRPELLEELGLAPALEALCAEHAQHWGFECRVEITDADDASALASPALSTGLYRIAQEALNNVGKHALASEVNVRLDGSQAGQVVLRIADNGIGMRPRDQRDPASFGLLGMAERVRVLGGQLRLQSLPDAGTMIEVSVPTRSTIPAAGPSDPALQPWPPEARAETAVSTLRDLWERPLQSVVDAMDGNVAVVDRSGTIRLVNRGWREFAAGHGAPGLQGCGPGTSYLDVCRRSASAEPQVGAVLQGLIEVLEGRNDAFVAEYPCDSAAGCRWFRMHVAPIAGGWTIVSHVEINDPGGQGAPNEQANDARRH